MLASQLFLPVISAISVNNHVNQTVDLWAQGSAMSENHIARAKSKARKFVSNQYENIIIQAQDESLSDSPTLIHDIEDNALRIAETVTDSFLLNNFKRHLRK
jgi:hypothetical protein